MKVRLGNELLLLDLLTIVLIVVTLLFPSNIVRVILGVPFLLFFPGYTLMAALYPKREAVASIERIALSLGMSIAVVPLIGLLLNFFRAIRLEPILFSVALFVFITSGIAWLRRRRLPKSDKFNIEFRVKAPALGGSIWRGSTGNRLLSAILMLAILGSLAMLGYVIAMPRVGDRFTEFYIAGQEGQGTNYTQELRLGETGKVTIGIINQEYDTMSYRIAVRIGGVEANTNNRVGPIVLEYNERWEQEVSFTPQTAGNRQKVEFLLYRNSEANPYRGPLDLWVDVTS